ncbi:DEAD/DEAH box helicase [Thermoanaerobacterium thermosaccharolyticum]|uniref:DEAD/DEAH box helicase n=1 Tax=Thermoanaerobacterium thermosaccharolyticum TaxID=1517 RepID=UPI0012396026|nr:DEAD/DEAH box helicase [Thermoanaerobacterium thermosaccharolyticum]KAA5806214.1 DEAD/DEAH box helicase [Thermoanaerobacterium thermosaccharolyticum]
MGFKELGLNYNILKAIDDMGFEEPSKIQLEVIPVLLDGLDAIGHAETGTGKTLAYGAPVINSFDGGNGNVFCIILTPTRELAIQVNDELARIGKYSKVRLLPVYGGVPIDRQIKALKRGVDIVIGTPGRVLDLIKRDILRLKDVKYLVLDEADEMLDMGFIDDIEEIIRHTNSNRQTMMFSATMPDEIKRLAKKYMKPDAKFVSIMKKTMTVSTVDHYYYEIKNQDRFESLCRILDAEEPSSSIIFCKTKKEVDELTQGMQSRGYNVEGMHGDMSQSQRINTLRKFKEGNLDFLVATDVAARGIDVENVSHVINYDLPQDVESYVHRIGRTGRANRSGVAYTLVTSREYPALKRIERETKCKIRRKELPTVDDIFQVKYNKMIKDIKKALENDGYKRFVPLAMELDEEYNLVDVAAALMDMYYGKELYYNDDEPKYVRLFINLGRKDKLNRRTLLKLLMDIGDISKEDIGTIDIFDKFTFIDASRNAAKNIINNSFDKIIDGKRIKIEISKPRK